MPANPIDAHRFAVIDVRTAVSACSAVLDVALQVPAIRPALGEASDAGEPTALPTSASGVAELATIARTVGALRVAAPAMIGIGAKISAGARSRSAAVGLA